MSRREELMGRLIAVGLQHPGLEQEPWKYSTLLNALDICGYTDWLHEIVVNFKDRDPFILENGIADCVARIRSLVRAGFAEEAQRATREFLAKRVDVDGVTEHAQARSTRHWLWIDSAYMVPPSMALVGQDAIAVGDLLGLYRHLVAPSGLLRHLKQAINVRPDECLVGPTEWIDGTAWGRGNGWFVAGSIDTIDYLMSPDPAVVANYQAACDALLRHQDENGTWRTIIDDPETPAEMSATAMIIYAFLKGHRLGYLPTTYRSAGLRALDRMMSAHFTWSTAEVRDQQYGPMIYNVPTRTAFQTGLSYGQAFASMSLHEAWS
jgi:unsaturated rhamnogalacturonyl hydrolase